jgi:predicted ester cyclase
MNQIDDVANDTARRALVLFYRAVAHQDIALLSTVVTQDWQYIPASCRQVAVRGAEAMAHAFAALSSALSDMQITIDDVLIHGNQMGVRARVTGTQSGLPMGIPTTSKSVDFATVRFMKFARDASPGPGIWRTG